MAYCTKCGNEVHDEAVICVHCGCPIERKNDDSDKLIRFLLTFFLGWIGSFIINNTSLKPVGWKSRTVAYFFLSIITMGIYPLVASICNFTFNTNNASNIGYFRD